MLHALAEHPSEHRRSLSRFLTRMFSSPALSRDYIRYAAVIDQRHARQRIAAFEHRVTASKGSFHAGLSPGAMSAARTRAESDLLRGDREKQQGELRAV